MSCGKALDRNNKNNTLHRLLKEALRLFDHENSKVHNKLIVAGADRVLAGQLEIAVVNPHRRHGIIPLCRLFLMLYRCDDEHFQDSLAVVGGSLFPSLLAASYTDEFVTARDGPIRKLIQRVEDIRIDLRDVPWAGRILEYCIDIIEKEQLPSIGEENSLSFVLSWLVDGVLTKRENNKRFIMSHPALFDCIVQKFASNFSPACPENLQVSRFGKTMALATSNRLIMVRKNSYLQLLFLLLHDEETATRVTVYETLALLSLDKAGRNKIFSFLDHKIVDMSIKALRQRETTSGALAFLEVLIKHFTSKIILFACPKLPNELAWVSNQDETWSLQAAQALRQLSVTMSLSAGGSELLDCLLQLCDATDPIIRYEGVRTLYDQCVSSPGCEYFVVRVGAVSKLASMASDADGNVKALTIELVEKLASRNLNARPLAKHKHLLAALAAAATSSDSTHCKKTQRNAMTALLHLVMYQKPANNVEKSLNKRKTTTCSFNATNGVVPWYRNHSN